MKTKQETLDEIKMLWQTAPNELSRLSRETLTSLLNRLTPVKVPQQILMNGAE